MLLEDRYARSTKREGTAASLALGPLLQRFWPALALLAAALLAIAAYGNGLIVADSYSELHIDPIGFYARMQYAWDTQGALGVHTGWMHCYEEPYGWAYLVLAVLGVPGDVAQRVVVCIVEFTIGLAMYWGLGALEPRLPRLARLCGSLAYLFNIYVAFNLGNGYSSFLLPYAATPLALGVSALVLRGAMRPVIGGCWIGLCVVLAGGVNPPLLVILAILIALYIAIDVLAYGDRLARLRRLVWFAPVSLLATLALNAYWIGPFLDYGRTFWLGSQLDESPIMHNVDTSFSNVLRGFGQWGIFRGDGTGLWFPWSAWFVAGFFYFASWLPPFAAFLTLSRRSARTPLALYCVVLCAISIPIVVGYHSEGGTPALTFALYDFLYSHVPGFQMFRSAYKWVWPLEFATSALLANAAWLLLTRARLRFGVPVAALLTALPLVLFVPMLVERENHSVPGIPAWYEHARSIVGGDAAHRVAVFPGQYVPQYDWADEAFYIENSYLPDDLLAGYISGAPNQGSHLWLTRAYRSVREGDPSARAMFRMLGAGSILARDDFRSESDFAYVGDPVRTDTTEMHDEISSVLGATPRARDGALRSYTLRDALPDVYLAHQPLLSPLPAIAIGSAFDPTSLAAGEAVVSGDGVAPEALDSAIRAGLGLPVDAASLDGLATSVVEQTGAVVTSLQEQNAFKIPATGRYEMFVLGLPWNPKTLAESWYLLPGQVGSNYSDPYAISIDGHVAGSVASAIQPAWTHVAAVSLAAGWHTLHINRLSLRPFATVAFVDHDVWARERSALGRLALRPEFAVPSASTGSGARTLTVPRDSEVRLSASPVRETAPSDVSVPVSAASMTLDTDFASAKAFANGALDLPYVPRMGTTMTAYRLMPKDWYLDGDTYDWNRGGITNWCLLARTSHFAVFSPAAAATSARVRMRLAILREHLAFDVYVNGVKATSVDVKSDRAAQAPDRNRGPRGLRYPVPVTFDVPVRPGYNDVAIEAGAAPSIPAQQVDAAVVNAEDIVAAVAWDLSFERTGFARSAPGEASGTARGRAVRGSGIATIRVPIEGLSLEAEPQLDGVATDAVPGTSAWLAELVDGGDSAKTRSYRILPIAANGPITNSLVTPLDNGFSDARKRILRAWLVFDGPALPNGGSAQSYAANLSVGHDRGAWLVHRLPVSTLHFSAAVEGGVLPKIAYRSDLATMSPPPGKSVQVAATFTVPRAPFAFIKTTVLANQFVPHVRLDALQHGRYEPVGLRETLRAARISRSGDTATYRVDLPPAMRPLPSEFSDGALLFSYGRASRVEVCARGSAPDAIPCIPDIDGGRIAAIQLTLPATGPVSITVFRPVVGSSNATNGFVLTASRAMLAGANRVRLVVSGTSWQGPNPPALVFSGPVVSYGAGEDAAPALDVDGRPFSAGRLRAGRHVLTAAASGPDIDTLRVSTRSGPAWDAVTASRTTPSSLDVALPASRSLDVLVLNESFHPEWNASANGIELQHVWTNGFANGWLVPKHAGVLNVRIRFEAQKLYDATRWFSFGSFCVVVAVLASFARRRRGFAP